MILFNVYDSCYYEVMSAREYNHQMFDFLDRVWSRTRVDSGNTSMSVISDGDLYFSEIVRGKQKKAADTADDDSSDSDDESKMGEILNVYGDSVADEDKEYLLQHREIEDKCHPMYKYFKIIYYMSKPTRDLIQKHTLILSQIQN